MTNSEVHAPNLHQWYTQLNQHEADRRDIEGLEQYLRFIDRLGAMVSRRQTNSVLNLEIFSVHDAFQHGSLTTPLLGYVGQGFELRLLMLKNNTWLESVKVTNGKPPAFPKVNKLLKAALPPELVIAMDHHIPNDWNFGGFDANPREFTARLNHDYWVFALTNLLLDELSQH